MFNLLPEKVRSKIKKEYLFRRGIVVMIFVISLQVLFLVMILPTWFVTIYKERVVRDEADKMNKYLSTLNMGPVNEKIKAINQKMSILNNALEYQSVTPFFDIVLSRKTESIFINRLAYTFTSPTSATIVVDGVSANRESLVGFVKSLERTGKFIAVDLPISNLAKDKNISFSLKITVDTKPDEK